MTCGRIRDRLHLVGGREKPGTFLLVCVRVATVASKVRKSLLPESVEASPISLHTTSNYCKPISNRRFLTLASSRTSSNL